MNLNEALRLAGLPLKESTVEKAVFDQLIVEATVDDKIVYTHANHKSRAADAELNGTEYDPEAGTMTVGNRTSLAGTHRALERAGWKKSKVQKGKSGAVGSQDKEYQLGDK